MSCCCSTPVQQNAGNGPLAQNHNAIGVGQAAQFALPGNFDAVTACQAVDGANVMADDASGERFVQVDTALNPHETDFTPSAERHSHRNYFGPATWIIGDVFKPPGGYGLNQAVMRQSQIARAQHPGGVNPTDRPTRILIHNVVNANTYAYLNEVVGPSFNGTVGVPLDGFAGTTFGKAVGRIVQDIGHGAAVQSVRWRAAGRAVIIAIRYG